MTSERRLPRAEQSERYLIQCCVGWPDRAAGIVPLIDPRDFSDQLHAHLWRAFRTQLDTKGEVDTLAAGKQLNCCAYLLELTGDLTTTAHAEMHAETIREAARARALYDVLQRAADAIMRGRTADSVLAQLELALPAFHEGATA